jgi:hypothetical protein
MLADGRSSWACSNHIDAIFAIRTALNGDLLARRSTPRARQMLIERGSATTPSQGKSRSKGSGFGKSAARLGD